MLLFFLACFIPTDSNAERINHLIGDSDRPIMAPVNLRANKVNRVKPVNLVARKISPTQLKINHKNVPLACSAKVGKEISVTVVKNMVKAKYSTKKAKDCKYDVSYELDISTLAPGNYIYSAHGLTKPFVR